MEFEKWLLQEIEHQKILTDIQIQQAKNLKMQDFMQTGESTPLSTFLVKCKLIKEEQLNQLIQSFTSRTQVSLQQKKLSSNNIVDSRQKTLPSSSIKSNTPTRSQRKTLPKEINNSGAVPVGAQQKTLPQRKSREEFDIPNKFDHYEIIQKLGEGSFGEVYLAVDERLKREVAVKVLAKMQNNDIDKFHREVRIVAKLQHPNIAKVYDVGQVNGKSYFTMDYIKGSCLEDLIKQCRRITSSTAAEIIQKLAKALHSAHRAGIIHCDIKPANIMIDQNGEPYLMDFGLAHSVKDNKTNGIVGTPHYMSPEQAQSKELTIQSDVYSLGATLYEMLCGFVPFPGKDLIDTLRAITEESVRPPSQLYPYIPPVLEKVCLKALEKSLNNRYRNALNLAKDIDNYIAERETKEAVEYRVAQKTNRYFWISLILGGAIFLLSCWIVITSFYYSNKHNDITNDLSKSLEINESLKAKKITLEKRIEDIKSKNAQKQEDLNIDLENATNRIKQQEQRYNTLEKYAIFLRHNTLTKSTQKDWRMAGGNLQRNGFVHTQEVDLIYKQDSHFSIDGKIGSEVVIANDLIYLTSGSFLYAMNKSGKTKWSFEVPLSAGEQSAIAMSPIVIKDVVYFVSKNYNTKEYKYYIYAINNNVGSKKWQIQMPRTSISLSSLLYWKSTLYLGSKNSKKSKTPGYFYAIDSHNGSFRWELETSGAATAATIINNRIFFSNNKAIYSVNSKGKNKKRWSKIPEPLVGYLVSDAHMIYFCTRKNLFAYDSKNKKIKWKFSFRREIRVPPAVGGGIIYQACYDTVYAINRQGEEINKYSSTAEIAFSPTITPSKLYFASSDGYIYAFNIQNSEMHWKYASGDVLFPPIILDGKIYFSAVDKGKSYFRTLINK